VLGRVHMPPLAGATEWLESEPLGPAELRGRVVLVSFWTLTCINWLRQEPYVRAWSQSYRNDGLVVIGVHTPEFSFEHEIDRVRRALAEREIDYPVAVDNHYAIWSAFDNHYWPAIYFIDTDGIIRDHHFGEGRYEQSERVIQRLLGVERELVSVEGLGVEAAADWEDLRTPETYLGYGRGERFASPDGAGIDKRLPYELPERLRLNQWALAGEWTIGRENVVLDRAAGSTRSRSGSRSGRRAIARTARGFVRPHDHIARCLKCHHDHDRPPDQLRIQRPMRTPSTTGNTTSRTSSTSRSSLLSHIQANGSLRSSSSRRFTGCLQQEEDWMVGAPFEIHESNAPDLVRLRLVGELDIATAPVLTERLNRLRSAALVVRLDLSVLEFIDSSGLHVLLEAVHDSERLVEVEPELAPQVRRLLELTHTDRVIMAGARTDE
jgi:anti-anti-sigma factor